MTLADPHQVNDYRGEPFSHPIPHQTHIQNARVSFDISFSMLIHIPQVPHTPTNGQPEAHWEDIPPPVRDVAGPGRVRNLHHFDAAYQGTVDYIPQPLVDVSNSYTSATPASF